MYKVMEQLIQVRITRHLTVNGLFSKCESEFRRYHSTETAVIRVLSDIYSVTDKDQVYLIAILDVIAAFNTVNHGILM